MCTIDIVATSAGSLCELFVCVPGLVNLCFLHHTVRTLFCALRHVMGSSYLQKLGLKQFVQCFFCFLFNPAQYLYLGANND